MKNIFNKNDMKEERDKKLKEEVKLIETKELRAEIKDKEEFIEIAKKEYDKRQDRKIKDVLFEEFYGIIDYGLVIFLLGIIMLGAIPNYFNVNDEFLNPTLNMSVNESLEIVAGSGYKVIEIFHDIGARRPEVFFWLFFGGVFLWLIYPIIKVIIFAFKKQKGGGIKSN